MKGSYLRWGALAVLVIGALMLTFAPTTANETAPDAREVVLMVPIAYFLMLVGAVGLCWGWFKKNKV